MKNHAKAEETEKQARRSLQAASVLFFVNDEMAILFFEKG
jgi:hypothetical protein